MIPLICGICTEHGARELAEKEGREEVERGWGVVWWLQDFCLGRWEGPGGGWWEWWCNAVVALGATEFCT